MKILCPKKLAMHSKPSRVSAKAPTLTARVGRSGPPRAKSFKGNRNERSWRKSTTPLEPKICHDSMMRRWNGMETCWRNVEKTSERLVSASLWICRGQKNHWSSSMVGVPKILRKKKGSIQRLVDFSVLPFCRRDTNPGLLVTQFADCHPKIPAPQESANFFALALAKTFEPSTQFAIPQPLQLVICCSFIIYHQYSSIIPH